MRKIGMVVVMLFFLSGCAKLAHLQELLTMKSLSDNQDAQERYVKQQKAKFEKLLEVVRSNRLKEYPTTKSFLRNFGEPILIKEIEKDGQKQRRWLYRYSTKAFDSEKVYLYFDGQGRLLDFEYLKAPKPKDISGAENPS